jgi:hypothetical protein
MGDATDHRSHDLSYLLVARQTLADTVPEESWTQRIDDSWCHLQPRGHRQRARGREIHLSATTRSAEEVLARAVAVLGRHRTAFRFAKDPQHLRELLSIRRDGSGFITAYPDDHDQFQRLADDLHLATAGLIGPALLPDRPTGRAASCTPLHLTARSCPQRHISRVARSIMPW